jgi:FKBP-type peptidyl-prolyl cis-trans isomerase
MYEVLEKGKDGASAAKVGDLVAIRFKGNYKTLVFDDTFKTEEPYFYRAGVGLIAKGVDDAVVHMKVGDKLHLEFGGDLGFGLKGRPQSPGVPRIPPNAPLSFDVLLEDLPGTGEDFIADYDAPASDNDD